MALRADDVDLARDGLLVERFQAGDASAFDDLYRRYFARLRRYCLKRVGDPVEAEELAQEAFVRALRAMPDLRGERRFYPWMTVIAHRLCVDLHRRRTRTQPSDAIDLGAVEGGQEAVFDEVDADLLSQAMARLAPRHREVLELRAVHGWSYQRIADHYGVNLGTVESLLLRARKALRREFLAVAGDEGARRWGALPVLAWFTRRWHGARLRAAQAAADLTEAVTPLMVKAASVVVAVGSTVGMTGGPAPVPAASPAIPARPALLADARLVAATAAVPATPVAAPSPAPAPAPAARPAAVVAAPAPEPQAAAPAVPGVRVTEAREAEQEAERTPVNTEVLGTTVGVDPGAPVEKVTGLVGQMGGGLS
jgi:RNA polymerase sigma-70 factor (ECF subfamily)